MLRFGIYSLAIAGGVSLALYHKNISLRHVFKGFSGGEL